MPDDADTTVHYDQDYYLWALSQARALRSARDALADLRTNDWRDRIADLDWENLAEEIESLAQRDYRELGSRISTIVEHLEKLHFSPAPDPRGGWIRTIDREREEISILLRASPSLRRHLTALIEERTDKAAKRARDDLSDRGELAQASLATLVRPAYTPDQILTDWWPENPHPSGPHLGGRGESTKETEPNP